jgi:protein TonB
LFQSGNFTLSFGDWKPIVKGQVNFQCKIEALPRYYIGMSNEEGSDFEPEPPVELQDMQNSPDTEMVYTYVDFMPDMTAFLTSVRENLRYSSTAKDAGTEGTVYVRFIIETTGEITNVRAMNSLEGVGGQELVLAAEQAIRMIGRYEPARQNGNPIRLERTLPISFTLSDEEKEKPKK